MHNWIYKVGSFKRFYIVKNCLYRKMIWQFSLENHFFHCNIWYTFKSEISSAVSTNICKYSSLIHHNRKICANIGGYLKKFATIFDPSQMLLIMANIDKYWRVLVNNVVEYCRHLNSFVEYKWMSANFGVYMLGNQSSIFNKIMQKLYKFSVETGTFFNICALRQNFRCALIGFVKIRKFLRNNIHCGKTKISNSTVPNSIISS